jgi:hypothetical protein
MKYKMLLLVDEEEHHLRDAFERFFSREDIEIIRYDTVGGRNCRNGVYNMCGVLC